MPHAKLSETQILDFFMHTPLPDPFYISKNSYANIHSISELGDTPKF